MMEGGMWDVAIGGTISGSMVATVAVGLAKWLAARFAAKLDALTARVEKLEEIRIGAIERRMQVFEAGCQAKHDRLTDALNRVEHMAADLANIVGWTKKLDAKMDRIAEETSGQRSDIAGQAKWLQNLDNAHNAHVRDREVHHG